jgi:hypothetical protein
MRFPAIDIGMQISGVGDLSIQGFATDISVNKGSTIHFKIDVNPATTYSIKIYRLGYYQAWEPVCRPTWNYLQA